MNGHICEVKVRLTEEDDKFLKQLAATIDVKPAVLARAFIRFALKQQQQANQEAMSAGRAVSGLMWKMK